MFVIKKIIKQLNSYTCIIVLLCIYTLYIIISPNHIGYLAVQCKTVKSVHLVQMIYTLDWL